MRLIALMTLAVAVAPVPGATLERLTLDQMARQASSVVRAQAGETRVERRGALLYTLQTLRVLEQWKGTPLTRTEVALPGGSREGVTQSFGGVPKLEPTREYVVFLWRGRNGLTHVLGLGQGLFEVRRSAAGEALAVRPPLQDLMMTPGGAEEGDAGLEMGLRELRERVDRAAAQGESSGR